MSDCNCIICDAKSTDDGVVRLNVTGESGLWACFKHRKMFERGLKPTTEVLERAMAIKAKLYS